MFVKKQDREAFIKTIDESKKYFWEHTKKWHLYTDKIIYMIWNQIKKLEKSFFKEIKLVNIYTKQEINGKLIQFNDNELYIEWKWSYILNEWEII